MKSWITTLFGFIATCAGLVGMHSADPKTKAIATTVSLVAGGLVGVAARDNNKSSQDVGVRPDAPPK